MLTWQELEKLRADFEQAYAKHAKRYAGLEDTVEEIAALVKKDRRGDRYGNDACSNAWIGYQLAPIPKKPSTPDFLADLDRDQLRRCVELATERLDKMAQAEKVPVWLVRVDGTRRFTATSANDALDWVARFSAAFQAAPTEGLMDDENYPVTIQTRRVFADELQAMLSVNDKPEDFAKW